MRRRSQLTQKLRTWYWRQRIALNAPRQPMTLDLIFADPQPWILGEGWLSAFHGVATLGQVMRVTKKRHAKVFTELAKTPSHGVIAIGFDHHTPYLHDTEEKRRFWQKLSKPLIPIFYERIVGTPYSWNEDLSRRAAELAHFIVYNCGSDELFVQSLGKPFLWQPFGVDPYLFKSSQPYTNRLPRAFFDGKVDVEEVAGAYNQRTNFLRPFGKATILERLAYDSKASAHSLRDRYNTYQAVLNPPSIYSGHTCRVWEALACGCLLFTPKPATLREERLFISGRHLVYIETEHPEAAKHQMEEYLLNPALYNSAREIAREGNKLVSEEHTLGSRLQEIISEFQKTR